MRSCHNYAIIIEQLLAENEVKTIEFKETVRSSEGDDEERNRFGERWGWLAIFKTLTICAKFGSETQAMIVYDLEIPAVAKDFPPQLLYRAFMRISFQI